MRNAGFFAEEVPDVGDKVPEYTMASSRFQIPEVAKGVATYAPNRRNLGLLVIGEKADATKAATYKASH